MEYVPRGKVLANPRVHGAGSLLVSDGMNERNTLGSQCALDACEKFPIGSFADMFEHTHGNDPVVLFLMLAIILQLKVHQMTEAGVHCALLSDF